MLNRAAEHISQFPTTEFAPFPKWGEDGWQSLPAACRRTLIAQAEQAAESELPVLRASVYMDYIRNGNRTRYEAVYFTRRRQLAALLLGECAEGQGRFIDPLIDRIWAICEETSWLLPAHSTPRFGEPADALPDFEAALPYIDLFSAETGSLLVWTYYFLKERLEAESPRLVRRIEKEIGDRILKPFIERSDMWWMGLEHRGMVNNWNPWIHSNLLPAFLLLEKNPYIRTAAVKKIARSAQRFLDYYHEDGGCDEGPNYFTVAGASMLDILEILYDATDGRLSLYSEPLIGNMADYIRHVHIGSQYFVNYADAPGHVSSLSAGLLIRTGQRTGREALIDFARAAYRDGISSMPWEDISGQNFFRTLKTLFTFSDQDLSPQGEYAETGHYFPGIQVAIGRTADNLFFSAKGGHNNESHNHNDVGNYILYAGGQPCVIDVGVGSYSRKTFSPQRYDIWAMQSRYHNTAIVNGCDQLADEKCAAHSVCFEDSENTMVFSMNIEQAYAPEARLTAFARRFELNRSANTLTVSDCVSMGNCTEPVCLPVMCYEKPVIEEGRALINGLTLTFDPGQFTASFEEIDLNDPENPITAWGKSTLYRLLLTRTERKTDDTWSLVYSLS